MGTVSTPTRRCGTNHTYPSREYILGESQIFLLTVGDYEIVTVGGTRDLVLNSRHVLHNDRKILFERGFFSLAKQKVILGGREVAKQIARVVPVGGDKETKIEHAAHDGNNHVFLVFGTNKNVPRFIVMPANPSDKARGRRVRRLLEKI